MSDEDGFEDRESTTESFVFIGSLLAAGLMAILAGVWKWLRSWL